MADTALADRFAYVRDASVALAASLSAEDQAAQSMPDASPVKWHLAHTTWFFETFVLSPAGVAPFDPAFGYLFNSYYEALGARHPRPTRGLITRPGAAEVLAYRAHVDAAVGDLAARGGLGGDAAATVELGLAHEEQHQELILTDVLHLLAQNPLMPVYRAAGPASPREVGSTGHPLRFVEIEGGVVEIGAHGPGFAFDNEGPRHQVLLRPYRLADRLVTNAEWRAFIEDDGYRRAELWLADGWAKAAAEGWTAPLYWACEDDGAIPRRAFGLHGLQLLDPDAPVAHVSLYEADAFARWRGMRLPSEAEWEHAAILEINGAAPSGNFREAGHLTPRPATDGRTGLRQMFGDVWEWTASAYAPYPGFRPVAGALGEYNGKFMINQAVLRGGSCVTPLGHVRASYRNFFQPHQRWQVSGLRLAQDAD